VENDAVASKKTNDDAAALQPLGRRARKALAVRQALFEAGLAAFERQPIGLVSILDITEAADVAKGVFYLHFKSKDEYLLALWEEVQRRFLDSLRAETLGRRSTKGRVAAAVKRFARLTTDSPASARFWIRMSSYFPDEVGEPGHLARIHQEYVRQLAGVLAGRAFEELTPADVRAALVVSSVCWAIVNTSLSADEALCDEGTMIRIVNAAMKALGPQG
jgi:AcrR family transcriptional regulator